MWYDNTYNNLNTNDKWIVRGGNNSDHSEGIFTFSTAADNINDYLSTRIISK